MTDVVVTVPKALWSEWLEEGDLASADDGMLAAGWGGDFEYGFHMRGRPPVIKWDERVYIVAHGKLRGYAPLTKVTKGERFGGAPGSFALVRRGAAVACTLAVPIRGFQGYRYRWWDYADELPFPDWRIP
jgi:hypothetical protein